MSDVKCPNCGHVLGQFTPIPPVPNVTAANPAIIPNTFNCIACDDPISVNGPAHICRAKPTITPR